MLMLDAQRTRAALGFDVLVPALRDAFRADIEVPLRHMHRVDAAGAQGTVLIMPAWSDEGFLGIKIVNIWPGNGARGLPGLHSTYTLYEVATGRPLAHLDGNEITSRRTAAAAALAAGYLARPDAGDLLVLGTGRVARLLPDAFSAVRRLRRVVVWNHRPASAHTLAEHWRAHGYDASVATDLQAAVRAADIVSCATLATAPLVRGAWLRPGTHLDLIGSFTPQMRETDAACFAGTSVFVDTDEAMMKAGDLLAAKAEGTLRDEDVRARLADLCRDGHPGRRHADEVTVFKAVGTALEDLAAAALAYRAVCS